MSSAAVKTLFGSLHQLTGYVVAALVGVVLWYERTTREENAAAFHELKNIVSTVDKQNAVQDAEIKNLHDALTDLKTSAAYAPH